MQGHIPHKKQSYHEDEHYKSFPRTREQSHNHMIIHIPAIKDQTGEAPGRPTQKKQGKHFSMQGRHTRLQSIPMNRDPNPHYDLQMRPLSSSDQLPGRCGLADDTFAQADFDQMFIRLASGIAHDSCARHWTSVADHKSGTVEHILGSKLTSSPPNSTKSHWKAVTQYLSRILTSHSTRAMDLATCYQCD